MKLALEYMDVEARRAACMQTAVNCYAYGFYETAMNYQLEYYMANDERIALLAKMTKRQSNFINRARNSIYYGKVDL